MRAHLMDTRLSVLLHNNVNKIGLRYVCEILAKYVCDMCFVFCVLRVRFVLSPATMPTHQDDGSGRRDDGKHGRRRGARFEK